MMFLLHESPFMLDGWQIFANLLQLAGTEATENRFWWVPADLKVCVYLSQGGNRRGHYIIKDLWDLDYIHNHKMMLNPLDHATRALILGDYMVHINHIKRAYHVFSLMEHGLGACDINCHDRQNWRSVQKLSFLKVRDCLMEFIDRSVPNQRPNLMFLGMQVYLLIVQYHVEIFCSSVASLQKHIKYAPIVTHFSGNLTQLHTIRNIRISIHNQNIVKVKETNFLGLILDANINWKSEISRIANKVVKSIGIISSCSFFLPKLSLRMLYYSLIYP